MSDTDWVALRLVTTDFEELYAPGAKVAVMVATPAVAGVSQVAAFPFRSLVTEPKEAPLHAENCNPLLALHLIVAPLTGVTPSAARTRTLAGFAACVPTGVDGFNPCWRMMLSLSGAVGQHPGHYRR